MGIEQRVDALESRVSALESRVGSLESRATSVESRVTSLESQVQNRAKADILEQATKAVVSTGTTIISVQTVRGGTSESFLEWLVRADHVQQGGFEATRRTKYELVLDTTVLRESDFADDINRTLPISFDIPNGREQFISIRLSPGDHTLTFRVTVTSALPVNQRVDNLRSYWRTVPRQD